MRSAARKEPKSAREALTLYRQKRDFNKTAEPSGKAVRRRPKSNALSFVLQKHAATRLHYDFRLELDGVLKSWAVTRGPSLDPADKRLAVEVEDHPLDYGGFEGTIPKGQYGGGTVMLWDHGTWEPMGDPHEGLERGNLKFNLYGERMKGRWVLVRMKPRRKEDRRASAKNNWLLIKERDEEARDGGVPLTESEMTSVETGRDIATIAAGTDAVWNSNRPVKENVEQLRAHKAVAAKKKSDAKPPAFLAPQLATLVDAPPRGDEWLHEIKYDGYRAVASLGGGEVIIRTRTGLDWTERFGALAPALAKLPCRSALIDGEIAVADAEGRTNFNALQSALAERRTGALTYYVFDLIELDGKDLSAEPLVERKAALRKLIAKAPAKTPLLYSDHVEGGGAAFFDGVCALKLEGIVSKRADAPYRSGRTKTWLKVKCGMGQEFVIIGWRPSDVKGRLFSSLLVAVRDEHKLRYAGRVGSGFDEADLEKVGQMLKAREQERAPVDDIPADIRRRARFIRPDLVAEISFRGWTADGVVRQASFKGLRADKPAREVKRERKMAVRSVISVANDPKDNSGTIEIEGVRVTHPKKVLFKEVGLTKRDLIDYYLEVAEPMLKHVARRPLTLVRAPDGAGHEKFFQKHASPGFPEQFHRIKIKDSSGTPNYLYIEDVSGLVAAVQIGALELHIWGSHIDDVEKPDRIVFDLDPDEDLDFGAVKSAAHELHDRLDRLGLTSFVMATGGKGLHVVAPILPRYHWPDVKAFTHSLSAVMAEESPNKYTTVMSKAKRHGRIFIDYLRNDRGSTAIAPYSVRARKGAPIAVPLSWSGLTKLESAHPVTIETARGKLKKDPWSDYDRVKQDLPLDKLKNS